jgi:metal-sulfur cluster biosynthetic enzyme
MYTKEELLDKIRHIIDPEIGMSIVDMGLIYDAVHTDGKVDVDMTLTTPMCPLGPMMADEVVRTLKKDDAIDDVDVNFVFDPPWDPHTMANEEVKWRLGIFDDDEDDLSE